MRSRVKEALLLVDRPLGTYCVVIHVSFIVYGNVGLSAITEFNTIKCNERQLLELVIFTDDYSTRWNVGSP